MRHILFAAAVAAALLPGLASAQQQANAVTWGFASEVETLDPYATSKRTSQLVIRNVLENLAVRDPATGQAKPALATAWRWIDATTLHLELRRGVSFHDGSAFGADDVVYTVDYIKNPANNASFAKADYGFIRKAEKVDDHTVRLLLEQPTPSAVDQLTQVLFILPKATHEKMGARAFAAAPVGTGPMKVEKFEAGRSVTLVRNDRYYAADWGKPRLDRINVVVIPDPQTASAELAAGKVDFLWNIQPDQLMQLKMARNVETATGGSVAVSFLSLDAAGRTGANPMQDKNVRMAIAHAIDRTAIAKTLRGESSEVIHSPCNPRQFGCIQDVVRYDTNLAKARELMAKSSVPKGFELKIAAFTDSGPVAEAIAGDLRQIGIDAKLDFRETSSWIRDLFGGKLVSSVVPWPSNGVYDVVAMVPLFFTGDQGDYTRDPVVMDAFKQAATLVDPQERLKLYRTGFERLAAESYVVPLMSGVTHFAYRRGLDFTLPADGYPILYMAGWKR
jgi:peptide/nickel transport system substrate-binding protein